ncbi:MAG: FHA domain-containing protein [Gammaproteobacteria bacterium]
MQTMKKTCCIFVLALLCSGSAHAAAPGIEGVIRVGTAADVTRERLSSGFIADARGHAIAHIGQTGERLFVHFANGTVRAARMAAHDITTNLALLKIDGDARAFSPYAFARNPAEAQQKVFGIKVTENLAESKAIAGALAKVRLPDSGARAGYYLHNALVGKLGAGGPLFNNCGEVTGVIIPQSWRLRDMFNAGKESAAAYAVRAEWVLGQFGAQGLMPLRAGAVCLSEQAQAAAAQSARESAEQSAAQASAAKEEAVRRANEAAVAAAAAQTALDEMTTASAVEREDAERRFAEAAEAAAAAQAEREQAARRADETAQTLRDVREAARAREKTYMYTGIGGAAALLLLALLAWVLKSRAVSRARREKTAMQDLLDEREQNDARIWHAPTAFFEGADSAGQKVTLRIPGASMAADEGAVVGRNPSESDFIINHPQVSRRQFRLFIENDSLMIEDLGSTNGTIVNGQKLHAGETAAMPDNSRVQLSALILSVRITRK